MKQKAILMFVLIIGSIFLSGCVSPNFSTTGISTPLPVSVDYGNALPGQDTGKYWRVSAYVDGSGESYILQMPTSELVSGDTKAQKDLILKFEPTQPYWHASTYEDPAKLQYDYFKETWFGLSASLMSDTAPYTRISGVGQSINVGYTATLTDSDGKKIVDGAKIHNFNVDGNDVGTLQLKAKDSNGISRTIYITLNGLIPSGVLTPRGELATVSDGTDATSDSSHDMVNYLTFRDLLTQWNNDGIYGDGYSALPGGWSDAYSWMAKNGLSSQIPSTQVINADFEGVGTLEGSTPTGIRIYYGIGTFKPTITAYIPEELAETITETKQAPKPVIMEIKDLEVAEGGSVNFKVIVQNLGSSGDIQVSASSQALKNLKTMGDSTAYVGANKEYTWMFTGDVADEVTDDERDYDVVVSANGGVGGQFGTTDSETFTVTVLNADIPQDEMPKLHITTVYDESGEPFESASIFVGYGSDARVGTGAADVDVIAGIEYAIYSEDTSGFLAQYTDEEPKLVTAYTDKDIIIKMGEERPEEESDIWMNLLIVLGLLGVLGALWYFGIIKMLMVHPIYILILVLILVVIWATIEITNSVESTKDAIMFWK